VSGWKRGGSHTTTHLGYGLVALASPEDFPIVCGDLGSPDVKVLVALADIIVVPCNTDITDTAHDILKWMCRTYQ
jgi:hypothetical protein